MLSSTPSYTTSSKVAPLLINQADFLAKYPHINRAMASAIVFRTNPLSSALEVLLLLRAAHDSYALHWELPGGSVDDTDPTLVAAAVRELHEEAGLEVSHVEGFATLSPFEPLSPAQLSRLYLSPEEEGDMIDGDGLVISFMETKNRWAKATFLVDVKDDTQVKLDDNEHSAFTWVTEDEIRKLEFKDGKPMKIVCNGVRRTILHGFEIKQKK